jgi:hypothetical protein
MSKFLKVKDEDGLYRDTRSQGILNLNDVEYERHKQTKQFLKKKQLEERNKDARLNNLEQDVASLKTGIQQILELLKNVTHK